MGRMPQTLIRELGHPGSRSPFDRPITARRGLAFVDVPLAEARAVGASRPGHATVNDVLLAVISGAIRRRLLHHGHTRRVAETARGCAQAGRRLARAGPAAAPDPRPRTRPRRSRCLDGATTPAAAPGPAA